MFDPSAPHIIILLIVVLLLFGSRRLPGAARSLGQSMHIFKRSVQGMEPEDQDTAANPAGQNQLVQPVNSALPPPDPTAGQLADLQRQVAELQRQSAASNGGSASEARPAQPF